MAAKHPPPTLEARILAALRLAGRPLTVAELHGPGMPGLTSRRSGEIDAACGRMVGRRQLMMAWRVGRRGRYRHYSKAYGLPGPGPTPEPGPIVPSPAIDPGVMAGYERMEAQLEKREDVPR